MSRKEEQHSPPTNSEPLQPRRTTTTTRKRPIDEQPPHSRTHKKSKVAAEDSVVKAGDGTEDMPLEFYDDAGDKDEVVAKKSVEAQPNSSPMAQVVAKMWDGIKVKKDQL
jgi:hypothetical protein